LGGTSEVALLGNRDKIAELANEHRRDPAMIERVKIITAATQTDDT
jgi:hypothetical protein